MASVAADTHALVWYVVKPARLSAPAKAALEQAASAGGAIYCPSIALVEICYLVEKGRLPDTVLERLNEALSEPNTALVVVPLDLAIARAVQRIRRELVAELPD